MNVVPVFLPGLTVKFTPIYKLLIKYRSIPGLFSFFIGYDIEIIITLALVESC